MTLVFLRWTENGVSRRASVRRAKTDAGWRAAMGLDFDVKPPDERTVRDFERFLRERHPHFGVYRYLLVHEHVVRLCLQAGVVGDDPVWTMDSTNMWCFGAVRDTVNLLGDGLRMLARQWAEATRTSFDEVVRGWDAPWLKAPSTKGWFSIDWRDGDARADVLRTLAEKSMEVVQGILSNMHETRRGKRKRLYRLCRNLLLVISQNLEQDENGDYVVAQRVATDRIVSLTDPEARHGRKSKSKRFNGYKLHVLGDAISGLILSLAVTPGNQGDGGPAPRLIKRAKAMYSGIKQVLGDTAYGGARLRYLVRGTTGVDILAPPVGVPSKASKAMFNGEDFAIDLNGGWATCPDGVTTIDLKYIKDSQLDLRVPRFHWPKTDCAGCLKANHCPATKAGTHRIVIGPYDEELRAARAQWDDPATRAAYRKRSQCERLVNETVRRGARKAASWGLQSASFQSHCIVTTNNLRLLAQVLANEEDKRLDLVA